MTIAELNVASREDFCAALKGIWEHSPWVAEAVVEARPFADLEALARAMAAAVAAAEPDRQLDLLCAHPDLAGKLAVTGGLTPESAGEQASAGLDQLTKSEFKAFSLWNQRYRWQFGFPFIICVRAIRTHATLKSAIRAAFRIRLQNTRAREFATALDEVRKIAEYRLHDRVTP